jgi:O-antigen/teichoic acid export membrane protein
VAVVAIVMSAAATIMVLLMGGSLVGMLAAGIPVTILARLIMIWTVRRVAPEFSFSLRGARRDLARKVLSFSLSTFILQVADNWQARIDEVVIGAFLPVSSVGFYAVARRISTLPSVFSDPVLSAFLPLASTLHAQDDADRLRSLYLAGTRVVFAICVPMLTTVVVLAGPLLSIWVGAKYAVNAPIAVVLAVAGVLEIGYWPGRLIVQGIDQHHDISKAALCAAIANVVLSLLLVRPLGLMGVALGTLFPAVVVNLGFIWPRTMRAVRVTGRELLKQAIAPTVVPALPMAVILYALNRALEPAGVMIVGFLVALNVVGYAAIFMTFFASINERQLARHFVSRLMRKKPSLSSDSE